MSEPLLAGRELGHTVDGRQIVSDVSLELWPAERVALIGPSGSGKTTLLTLLAGLVTPATGDVFFAGAPLRGYPANRRQVALVLQGYGLVATLTAAENVEVAVRATGRRAGDAIRVAAGALDRLGLSRFAGHLVDELSGGQRQRVAVARALALQPKVLLADEPTAEQDAEHEEIVLEQILQVGGDHATTVLVATHDPDVAARCDRVVELADGRLVGPGGHPGAVGR